MEYYPEVVQVIPTEEYKVYIYFDDGSIKLFDASSLLEKGEFQRLKDKKFFMERCTVLNGTLAWDVSGNYDETTSLDVDPLVLYQTCPDVDEPEWLFKQSEDKNTK
ncbi:DUF2442 domain-containing protein [Caldicellulosiruptor changbaiensis]|uniref:DUF2442 domain-containing protein n=1 Tax=Caldicellulosiruptor changbaiensis TaxID=1222016 RepID=A0A3T0D6N3_9FIRM|nr:DUF2442 domain-containing protein [Caldicellulosiruptor changbaiensis]AZT90562.1 DUF2442 domain-containing protein [Caldicellulosiruptor changbaiensis]